MKMIETIGYNGKPMILVADKVLGFQQKTQIDEAGGPILTVLMANGSESSEEWNVKDTLDNFRNKLLST